MLTVFFRIVLYLIIAALIAVNFHFYMLKRADDTSAKASSAVPSSAQDGVTVTAAEQLPPVEPPRPQANEVITPGIDNSALAQKARDSFLKKDYKNSAELCRQLAEKNNKAYLCLGISLFMLEDYTNSITNLEKALEAGADEYTCNKYLAFSYYYRHDFDKSLLNSEKALTLNKDRELAAFHDRLVREKRAHQNFASESTNHFKIQFDGYEHGGISRTVIGMLEDAYSSIGRDLDYYPSEPVTVVLYTNHDFYDVTEVPGWVGGFFDKRDGKIRVPVRGAQGHEAKLREVLAHEYVHALIHSFAKPCPRWIHEGLANYYARGSAQKIGQIIPMEHLDNAFQQRDTRIIRTAYIQSLSAVSYLMSRYGPSRMKDLLISLSKGNDLNQAFTLAFQMSYTEFSDKWGKI